MKKVLILHGWGGNSMENWFPRLQKTLIEKGFQVFVPNLPHSDSPILEEQLESIKDFAEKIGEGDYIIGHSLGCVLSLCFLQRYNLKNVNVILVAPTYKNLDLDTGKEVFGKNYQNLKKYFDTKVFLAKLDNTIKILLSDNDPYINMKSAKKYYSNLKNCEFVDFIGKGHFNETAGILDFPEILEHINLTNNT